MCPILAIPQAYLPCNLFAIAWQTVNYGQVPDKLDFRINKFGLGRYRPVSIQTSPPPLLPSGSSFVQLLWSMY